MGTWDDGIYYPDESDASVAEVTLEQARHRISGKCWYMRGVGADLGGGLAMAHCQNEGEFWQATWVQPEWDNYTEVSWTLVCGDHRSSYEREAREAGVPVPEFVPR